MSSRMQVVLYGIVGGLLVAALRYVEYRWLIVEHSVEIYGGLVAAFFAAVGIWLGVRLTRRRDLMVVRVPVPVEVLPPFVRDAARQEALGITGREMQILELIAEGLSTREIAGRAFLSENTVKTHASRLFDKLGARRRTQAVQRAKELGLLP